MTTITIVYHKDDGDESVEGVFDNPAEAVRWTVASLAGWCLDEDVSVWVDGVPFWQED